MVSIQYGGGPTLEQQRAFCNPLTGSHIPGYSGFVPQAKFQYGTTYGQETHYVAKKLPYYNGPKEAAVKHIWSEVGKSKDCADSSLFQDEIARHKLPIPTGDNKYTENMMPGYSGDIPRSNFKFGSTYRRICEEGVDEFINDYERNQIKRDDVQKMANMFPKLRPVTGNIRVRDHMNLWCDQLMKSNSQITDKRNFLEPPIPGYTGFIPRLNNTELGLGARYHVTTGKGLESFSSENKTHFQRLENPMHVENNVYTVQDTKTLTVKAPSQPAYSKRIFTQDGMIPEYTGHMHGAKEIQGYSYCDTNRMLPVCQHSSPCYGDYIRNIDLAV